MTLNFPRAGTLLDDAGLVGLVAATSENVFYASGLDSLGLILNRYQARIFVVSSRASLSEPVIVAGLSDSATIWQSCPAGARAVHYGSLYRLVDERADLDEHERWVKDHVVDGRTESGPITALARGLAEAGISRGRVGYDERGLAAGDVAELQRLLPSLELVPAWNLFRAIRAVKTAEEVRRLEASLRLTERALAAAVAAAEPGVSEGDLVREYAAEVAAGGGIMHAIDVTFGRRGALGTATMPGSPAFAAAPLSEGDFIRFDGGCKVNGYYSDIARTFVFRGSVPEKAERLYATLVRGADHAISQIRPGSVLSDVFDDTIRLVRDAGIDGYSRHHIGHSIGLEIYDGPMIGPGDGTVVEEGMVFEVEVPYQELGYGSLQIEDTIIVGGSGAEMITQISRAIESIE